MEEAGDVIVLSSNNYLGLADDPEVVAAGIAGLKKYGAGTASVRFICGTFDIHRTLEAKIASFLGTESALTYVSCWTANEGLLPTVGTAGNTLISDELNHASIIDGCRLAAAKRVRYKHGDMADLEARLTRGARHRVHRDRRRFLDGRLASRSCPRSSRWPRSTAPSPSSTTATAPASWARPGVGPSNTSG